VGEVERFCRQAQRGIGVGEISLWRGEIEGHKPSVGNLRVDEELLPVLIGVHLVPREDQQPSPPRGEVP
jgi:hypothetical protein